MGRITIEKDLRCPFPCDGGDRVARVEFFVNGEKYAQTSHPPYGVDWHFPSPGVHLVKAVAHTMWGQVAETPTVQVTVDSSCILP